MAWRQQLGGLANFVGGGRGAVSAIFGVEVGKSVITVTLRWCLRVLNGLSASSKQA